MKNLQDFEYRNFNRDEADDIIEYYNNNNNKNSNICNRSELKFKHLPDHMASKIVDDLFNSKYPQK